MFSSNQITGFFDNQYLRKKCIDILDFFNGDIYKEKVTSEAATFGWVFQGIPTLAQICRDSSRVPFDSLSLIVRLKVT